MRDTFLALLEELKPQFEPRIFNLSQSFVFSREPEIVFEGLSRDGSLKLSPERAKTLESVGQFLESWED